MNALQRSLLRTGFVFLLAGIAASCSDSAGPPDGRVATLTVVSGNMQQAVVASVLPLPLVVRALDAQGAPVRGATIDWQIAAANGTLTAGTATTDADGRASATWTLGTVAGALSATARIGTAGIVFVALEATALAGPATAVTVTPATAVLDALGATQQLQATARDAHNNPITGRAFTWTTTNAGVATVDNTGLARAVSTGTATVRAALDGATGEAQVMVQPQPASIFVTPPSPSLGTVGTTLQFQAAAQDRNGNALTLPATAYTWSSTSAAVATVDANGLATARGNGITLIRAAVGNVSGQAQLTVAQTPVSLAIAPKVDTLTTARPFVQIAVTALDANNQPIPNPAVVWTTSAATIATVSGTGLVNAVANGTVKIRATSGTLSDSATIVVRLNAAPIAVADRYATQTNTALVLVGPGVLANDTLGIPAGVVTSFGGGSLGGLVTTNVAGSTVTFGTAGSARVSADGSLTFTPSTGFNGSFTLQYRVTNAAGASDATITIDVGTSPTAAADAYPATLNTTLNVTAPGLIMNDTQGFPLGTIQSFGGGSIGGSTVTTFGAGQRIAFGVGGFIGGFLQVNNDGSFSFTPPTGFTGVFTFQYRLGNGIGTSDATVTITVS